MAFTGIAVVQQVSDRKFRITGLSLAAAAAGTIGFTDKTAPAEVSLSAPTWQPYGMPDGSSVSLIEAIEVSMTLLGAVATAVPVQVVKTGVDHAGFVITLTNNTPAQGGAASPELEIWVEYH